MFKTCFVFSKTEFFIGLPLEGKESKAEKCIRLTDNAWCDEKETFSPTSSQLVVCNNYNIIIISISWHF